MQRAGEGRNVPASPHVPADLPSSSGQSDLTSCPEHYFYPDLSIFSASDGATRCPYHQFLDVKSNPVGRTNSQDEWQNYVTWRAKGTSQSRSLVDSSRNTSASGLPAVSRLYSTRLNALNLTFSLPGFPVASRSVSPNQI